MAALTDFIRIADFTDAAPRPTLDALAAVLAKRLETMAVGHTPESDAARTVGHFAGRIRSYATAIADDVHFGKDAAQITRHTLALAALAISLLERLSLETAKDAAGNPNA